MFNVIKKEIKKFIDLRVRLIKDQQRLNQQQTFCYAQISNLFKEENFIPFTAFSISPSTILHVLNDIHLNQKQNIVEFGAGASTLYIAKLLQVSNLAVSFVSIESDKLWVEKIEQLLKKNDLQNYVKIILAPLDPVPPYLGHKDQTIWYNVEILKEKMDMLRNIDLILVDGPFGGSSPYARYSAIPFLSERLAIDYSIYLDDINRVQEQEIAIEWKTLLNSEMKLIERYALLSKKQDFDVSPFQLTRIPF